ncbi:MAG: hypothetical protein A3I77_06215 [Gammaproteobacteria bacterium RIFCSPLOWO2_02_FULL_42_14]|nr:MAG: hypothetical protein A3B71_06810 [Gammaproteobacteria bacterium RIFCSPHIGHO2_02_FULL_42_43]OGT28514.1 MAG: hypothetical protein A2624_00880 [Gammaproteobacteria bacterium RIFCSPHIGHO2_01_FULL_42_8]OGT52591.1 MAG: hypothetical protein A3E54_06410 [Gammaproteobacteria bacterium RIFCSPHIGHO2_12_FULL_41_25]OGT63189.1 MAG: hypothetical protein A3I77_06215 [Gammaproteobacteria bacterium RIFCSPLOWO2_02_FULL_42_14]OGT86690.1 MAG: hypothetical protein A3G86_05040 [Gammaproteobacteria bacterium R
MSESNAVPSGYEDYVYRFMYFILLPVVPFIPKCITPNQITILSFISAMTGTILLYVIQTPVAFLYWILFNFLWLVFDSLDGMHARLTQQTSEFGGFLDHALDCIYFVFMWTVIAIKFDLFYPVYVYILMLRTTSATLVFLTQFHTGKMMLSKFSGGLEFMLMNVVMLFAYYYPNFNPALYTTNSFLLHWIHLLHLEQGALMKLILFVYFFGVPIYTIMQFRFAWKHTGS